MSEVIYDRPGAKGLSFPTIAQIFTPENVERIVFPVQTHSNNVRIVEDEVAFPDTDALVTGRTGIALGIRTADCVPILFHDQAKGIIGVAHSGWKGTLGKIAARTVEAMESLGARKDSIRAVIGPAVCGLCYETSLELALAFEAAGLGEARIASQLSDPIGQRRFDITTVRIDLKLANRLILQQAGIKPENISVCGICTRHSGGWPSWRRNPGTYNRLASLIWKTE